MTSSRRGPAPTLFFVLAGLIALSFMGRTSLARSRPGPPTMAETEQPLIGTFCATYRIKNATSEIGGFWRIGMFFCDAQDASTADKVAKYKAMQKHGLMPYFLSTARVIPFGLPDPGQALRKKVEKKTK